MPQKQTQGSSTSKRSTGYLKDGVYIKSGSVDPSIKQHKERPSYRQSQRVDMAFTYAKDLIQPNDPDYYEANPNKFKGYNDVEER